MTCVHEGLLYLTKWGNYGMFRAWSLGRPCVMEVFLAFLFRVPL